VTPTALLSPVSFANVITYLLTYLLTHLLTICAGEAFTIPSFGGSSYLELRQLGHGFREIWVELTFRSLRPNGVLLYTGQSSDGVGDFMALVINAQYIEFRCSEYL